MNLTYILDYRFARTPDGTIWTDTAYDHTFWEPYLQVFDKVTLVSRVRDVAEANAGWLPVNLDRVAVAALPHYLGPIEFFKRQAEIRKRMRDILAQPGAVILRVPSQLSAVAADELKKLHKGYGVEVVGDPNAAFAPGVVKVKGRALMREWFTHSQKRICRNAITAAYVAQCLQTRYPANDDAETMVCSDVRLEETWLRPEPRTFEQPARHIITVATLSQTYKGIDVLLRAIAECRAKGHALRLTAVGHGKYQQSLEALAAELNIDDCVQFTGCVPWGSRLMEKLDQADLFVLPSRVEALPRALIEAMARALPAIASRVGAVPELLPPEQMVTSGNVSELAELLISTCNSPQELTTLSNKSLAVARGFEWRRLRLRWVEFHSKVAARTAGQDPATRRKRVALLTTNPDALSVFFRDQAKFLVEQGFEVCAFTSPGPGLKLFEQYTGAQTFSLPIERAISPARDVAAVVRLVRLLRQLKPDILHTHFPKSGIVGTLAGILSGCAVRLHTYHGLRSETLAGVRRMLVEATERWTGRLATRCFVVSESLKGVLLERQICAEAKLHVMGNGGCAGIDLRVFDPFLQYEAGRTYRRSLGIAEDAPVITYVGRIAREKGVGILVEAWKTVTANLPKAQLIVCGPPDATDPLPEEDLEALRTIPSIHFLPGMHADVTAPVAAADICVLPSFREGLSTSVLEASAMEKPVIGTAVTGITDTIQHGVTGLLVAPGNPAELAEAIQLLALSPQLRLRMGRAGRVFVAEHFDREDISELVRSEYQKILDHPGPSIAANAIKRVVDLAVAIPASLVALPVALVAGIFIRLSLGGPAIFQQKRAGLNGVPFTLYKLRTMTNKRDAAGELLPDSERLTRLGRFLRATSIDELPQLWNVLRGDMSLVGPRPLLERYLPRYSESQRRRHLVRPGITGLAQINGRNALTWQDKFTLDVWYVDHRSLAVDLRIVMQTVRKVFAAGDVSAPGHSTMPEFFGNEGNNSPVEVTAAQ